MFQESYMRKIVATVGVMAVVALIAYSYNTIKQAKYVKDSPIITVSGYGEVFAKPDIATFSFSIESKEADANTAQDKASETMKSILEYLAQSGVEEKDVKTENYTLSPQYEYDQVICTQWACPPAREPKMIGYQVSQSVVVKVRDTAKVGELVSGVGSKGALNVSSVSFTIDDEDALKAEAREKAIADAKEKAKVLAKNLDARIVRMSGYWENQDGGYPMPYGVGMGGDMINAKSEMSQPAQIPSGENMITSQISISYEIKSRGW